MRGVDQGGLYEVEAEDYHADPCPEPSLSNSLIAMVLSGAPRHAWQAHPQLNQNYRPSESKRLDLGMVAHKLLLDKGRDYHIIEANSYQTKSAQIARDTARELGKIPILVDDFALAQAMVRACHEQLADFPGAELAFDLAHGKTELGLFWQEPSGVWGRNLIDRLVTEAPTWECWDYKTTSRGADPSDPWFGAHFVEYGYDTQAAM